MSTYRIAIDHTTRAIAHRARYFRNQVVIVVVISTVTGVAAMVSRSAGALSAFLLLVPVCGIFFLADTRALSAWRAELLRAWIARSVDFAAFRQAIRAHPALPTETTEAMLRTLPSAGDLAAEQKVLTPTRQAIAAACVAAHHGRTERLLFNVVASAIVVGVLLAAVWIRAWTPISGIAMLAILPVVRAWIARRRQARCDAEIAACRAQPGFDEADYARIRAALR